MIVFVQPTSGKGKDCPGDRRDSGFKAISPAIISPKLVHCKPVTENAYLWWVRALEAVTREREVGLFEGGGNPPYSGEGSDVIVVPATANILGKAASGIGDDLEHHSLVDPSKL